MHTQNGRSPRPRAPATFTLCEHQLTLIFFFFNDYKLPSPSPHPNTPAAGAGCRSEPGRGRGSRGARIAGAGEKGESHLSRSLRSFPLLMRPPDPCESFPGPRARGQARAGAQLGRVLGPTGAPGARP